MSALYLDLDGEVVSLDHGSRAALVARLREADDGSARATRLATLLDGDDDAVDLALDDRLLLVAVVGRWHAEDGVLPSDLAVLRDAAAAAALRREIARR